MKRMAAIVLSLWTAISLVACTTINPYTEEKQTAKATSGAAIGERCRRHPGRGDRQQGAPRGTCADRRGCRGRCRRRSRYYMDVQEAKLRQKLAGNGVHVVRSGNDIRLVMPGDVTFETNSASLDPKFFSVLDSVATVLQEYKSTLVTVAGYTDSTGTAEHNQILSEKRATTVALYLNSREVAKERLAAIGHGESKPVAGNDTADGRAKNRRVEITLEPISK
jgi:outer membrane protein OmpA-like peptidoglycan-associated protein